MISKKANAQPIDVIISNTSFRVGSLFFLIASDLYFYCDLFLNRFNRYSLKLFHIYMLPIFDFFMTRLYFLGYFFARILLLRFPDYAARSLIIILIRDDKR